MKEEFLSFLKTLMEANPDLTKKEMTDSIKMYIDVLKNGGDTNKVEMTDNGKIILKYMKTLTIPMKSTDIANGMGVSSRSVSGAMRKLVADNYVEKIGEKNSVYVITTKGKDYKID